MISVAQRAKTLRLEQNITYHTNLKKKIVTDFYENKKIGYNFMYPIEFFW